MKDNSNKIIKNSNKESNNEGKEISKLKRLTIPEEMINIPDTDTDAHPLSSVVRTASDFPDRC